MPGPRLRGAAVPATRSFLRFRAAISKIGLCLSGRWSARRTSRGGIFVVGPLQIREPAGGASTPLSGLLQAFEASDRSIQVFQLAAQLVEHSRKIHGGRLFTQDSTFGWRIKSGFAEAESGNTSKQRKPEPAGGSASDSRPVQERIFGKIRCIGKTLQGIKGFQNPFQEAVGLSDGRLQDIDGVGLSRKPFIQRSHGFGE